MGSAVTSVAACCQSPEDAVSEGHTSEYNQEQQPQSQSTKLEPTASQPISQRSAVNHSTIPDPLPSKGNRAITKAPKKGGGKDYPSELPSAWESTLTAIEDFPSALLGTQMDAGWFATHSEYGPVFIKHFKKAETKNALRETAIFDRFDQELHSNLNSPLATEMYNGHVVLMQLRLGGGDLFDHIGRAFEGGDGYSPEEVRKIMLWLAGGVQFMHQHGVSHGDLKPENAMGGARSGYVKIVDFGTAKYFEQVAAGGNQELKACQDTDHQGLMLTKGYASLETLAARKNRSVPFNPFANDVHCLGAMLYVMLSGTNFPDNPTHEAIQAALDEVAHLSASSHGSCRALVEMMCTKESERMTINDVLEHPWIKNTQETASLPEGVFAGLIKLTRGKMIDGNPGDYLVQEVGTTASHIVEQHRMAAIYDLSSAINIDSLTAEQKTIMRKWEPAQKRGMKLYHATQVRKMMVINGNTLQALLQNWPELKTSSAAGTELVEVENAEAVPSNSDVFAFVKEQIQTDHPDFQAYNYKKLGCFAVQLTEKNCTNIELLKTKTKFIDYDEPFVYKAPWADDVGHSHMVLRAGDAFVYQQAEGVVYTMEKLALERNFDSLTSAMASAMALKQVSASIRKSLMIRSEVYM